MEGSEYMYAAAEVGVALAGFAALVIAIRQAGSPLSDIDRVMVASLVERGLVAAFLSFLPILLFGLGLSERLVWFLSSGAFVAYGVPVVIRSVRSRQLVASSQLVSEFEFYALVGVGVLVVALQVFHALGLGLRQKPWWYLVAVTWLLASAGYRFVFVLRGWVRAA